MGRSVAAPISGFRCPRWSQYPEEERFLRAACPVSRRDIGSGRGASHPSRGGRAHLQETMVGRPGHASKHSVAVVTEAEGHAQSRGASGARGQSWAEHRGGARGQAGS